MKYGTPLRPVLSRNIINSLGTLAFTTKRDQQTRNLEQNGINFFAKFPTKLHAKQLKQ